MTEPTSSARAPRFLERFASALVDSGMQRMAARVFTALLVADSGRRTAAELAQTLQASPAAISGAVRYLEQVSLAGRERDPGTRHDVYRVNHDVWYRVSTSRDRVLTQFIAALTDGIEEIGPATPAGQRLLETKSFFTFLREAMPKLVEQWQATREADDAAGRSV